MAISSALGAGHAFSRGRLGAVRRVLEPMWRALGKDEHGRVERRALRYAVHRHLLKSRSLSILGLEPMQQVGANSDVASLFTDHAPAYVRTLVEGSGAHAGFSIEDAVATVAMLEELAAQQGYGLIERLYQEKGWDPLGTVDRQTFDRALAMYLLRWMLGNDTETVDLLESNPPLLIQSFDDWPELVRFVEGRAEAHRHQGFKDPAAARQGRRGWGPLNDRYTLADAQAVVGGIILNFGTYWHAECQRVKASLTEMDYGSTGRVKLSDFHGAALDGEWRFCESQDYLRQLGALDETSTILGPRVILANYLQGASNCIISEPQYRVCCANDCEAHLAEIEESVEAPFASAEQLAGIVENITTTLGDDTPTLTPSLRSQLNDIANTHNGKVPLHGRLFSQWLHYVFPQDCPFPHKAGTVRSMSPTEYGDDYMATETEIEKNVAVGEARGGAVGKDAASVEAEQEWMTLWSQEEELVTNNFDFQAPWEHRSFFTGPLLGIFALLGATSLVLAARSRSWGGKGSGEAVPSAFFGLEKAHTV